MSGADALRRHQSVQFLDKRLGVGIDEMLYWERYRMSIRIRPLRAGMSGFATGVARLLDFGGALHVHRRHYHPVLPPGLADYLAIQSDWIATGQDIRRAISVLDPRYHDNGPDPKVPYRPGGDDSSVRQAPHDSDA